MTVAKILVVDDDLAICQLITRFLTKKNFELKMVHTGKNALEILNKFNPDLVILDVNLPDYLGYNLCEEMQKVKDVYILMLTSRKNKADKHQGFLKGADDYLTKPFDPEELELRIRAILKRRRFTHQKPQESILTFDSVTIDPTLQEVKVNNRLINLTNLEFKLLYFLANSSHRIWSRSELIQNVWDYDYVGVERVVDVHIGQIRRKIEVEAQGPCLIDTVRGVGYKFTPP